MSTSDVKNTTRRTLAVLSVVLLTAPVLDGRPHSRLNSPASARPLFGPGVHFIENRGQWDGPAIFAAQFGGGMAMTLERVAINKREAILTVPVSTSYGRARSPPRALD